MQYSLAKFIRGNSEQEMIDNGLNVGHMQNLQIKKIEELTLYIIDLQKQMLELQKQIEELKNNE